MRSGCSWTLLQGLSHPARLPACCIPAQLGCFSPGGGQGACWGWRGPTWRERAMRGMWRLKPHAARCITATTTTITITRHRLHFEQQYISAFSSLCTHTHACTRTRTHTHNHTHRRVQTHTQTLRLVHTRTHARTLQRGNTVARPHRAQRWREAYGC